MLSALAPHARPRQFNNPTSVIAARTFARVPSMIGASGKRQCSEVFPSSDAANFTGAGLVSANSASCSGTKRFWIAIASPNRPSIHASCIAATSRGATLALSR